ncbi:MAG TPA: hypothetical protein VLB50_02020, partial [Ignavibacteriaceae bacterium]|nr:hypothetical protein [Ignavibacteriaceae bacterium]
IYKNIEKPLDFKEFSYLQQRMNLLVSPIIIEKSGNEVKNLNDSSNIVIIWDDFFFSNIPHSQKIDWLNKTKLLIGGITNQKYYGISSFSALNDSNVVKSLTETGYSFVFSSGYSDAFEIDFDSTENIYYLISPSIPGLNYNSELNFIISNSGIFYLNADSLISGENFKQYLSIPDIWITTFSDLLNWRLKKNLVKASLDFVNDEYKIKVSNTGSSDIKDVGIWLSMPDINGKLQVKNPDNPIQLTFDNDKKMYSMKIVRLKSNQTMVFEISGMNE